MKKSIILFALMSLSLNTFAQFGLLKGAITKSIEKSVMKNTIISQSKNSIFNQSVSYSKDLEKQAKSGDSDAQLDLGICYLQGYGIKQNGDKAYEWLMASAENENNCMANYYIALLFEEGLIKEDGVLYEGSSAEYKAQKYYERAAKCGNSDAQYKMYNLTFRANEKKAMEWLNKAASNGNAEAIYTIALCTHNNKEKLELLQKAADLGYTPAKKKIEEIKQTAATVNEKSKNYRHIYVEKQNSILSVLPIEMLPLIDSLTITGILNENDLEILKECTHLRYLDLSNAYTTLSLELQKERKAEEDFLQGMFQAMGELSQQKYYNGEISTMDNLQVQLFAALSKGSSDVKESSNGCIIPSGAFSNMGDLEKVILPVRASEIESRAFQGCSNLEVVILPPYLKEIGLGAFAFCKNLKAIDFPETLTTIGKYDQQHTYGKSAAASFVESGIEVFDFSKCSFKRNAIDNSWSYRFNCKNLKVVKLPKGIKKIDVGFGSNYSVVCFVSSSVESLTLKDDIKEIHFSSENPPYIDGNITDCNIFVPKGCLTQYYAKFRGNGNILKEESW